MKRALLLLLLFSASGSGLAAVGHQLANGQPSTDSRVADLVRAGKLRAGLGVVAPHWAVKDQDTGELRGVAVDVARALAARIGIELIPVEYPSPPRVLNGLAAGAWDVGFMGIDPSRAALVDFSPPYLQIEATYLVPTGSTIRTIADADQLAIRIAVSRNSVEEIVLRRSIKRAELLAVETMSAGFELLRAGSADVLAAPRPTAVLLSDRLPGSRVLEDRFNVVFGAIAVPKGQTARLAYITEFIEEAKDSGFMQRAIEHTRARGVQVAPRGNPNSQ